MVSVKEIKFPEENILDYAMPMIKIERLMRVVHDECLQQKYGRAAELIPDLIAEVRVLQASLAIMEADKK